MNSAGAEAVRNRLTRDQRAKHLRCVVQHAERLYHATGERSDACFSLSAEGARGKGGLLRALPSDALFWRHADPRLLDAVVHARGAWDAMRRDAVERGRALMASTHFALVGITIRPAFPAYAHPRVPGNCSRPPPARAEQSRRRSQRRGLRLRLAALVL